MSGVKCPQCGMVNFATSPACKHCGAALTSTDGKPKRKSIWGFVLLMGIVLAVVLFPIFNDVIKNRKEKERGRRLVSAAATDCRKNAQDEINAADRFHDANPQLTYEQAYRLYAEAIRLTCK